MLDTDPTGQWVRADLLGIDQELLSAELLHKLAGKSLVGNRLPDNAAAWIERHSDLALEPARGPALTFLVAGSGRGKSVACFGQLAKHVARGFVGVVLTHDALDQASSLDQALFLSLRQLHPTLPAHGPPALSLASGERPFLLVVEDINRSGKAPLLVEKLPRWQPPASATDSSSAPPWRLLCPLWPDVINLLGDQTQRQVDALSVPYSAFTEDESPMAVLARAHSIGRELSALKASEIATALNCDPLLIALYDYATLPAADSVICTFVERAVHRLALDTGLHTATDFHRALRHLGAELLLRRDLNPAWNDLRTWKCLAGESLALIGRMVNRGDVVALTGPTTDQRLGFRHDRVREWILVDAAAELLKRGDLPDEVLSDAFFANIMGQVALSTECPPDVLHRIAEQNILAAFFALYRAGPNDSTTIPKIVSMLNDWLNEPTTADPSNAHLRWYCLALLAETDNAEVPALVRRFPDRVTSARLARLRNGDFSGGIELCMDLTPGTGAPWRDAHIAHAELRYGGKLVTALANYPSRTDIGNAPRVGALRMAGHMAKSSMANAILESWRIDGSRHDHLGDYLWAAAQCCDSDPALLLQSVCDAWATLSDQPNGNSPSPREDLVADDVNWAFRKWPPSNAIAFLSRRGAQADIAWPMQLLLHGVDHPAAVAFVVHKMAETQRDLEGTDSFSPFVTSAGDEWRRAQERGQPMSEATRDVLLALRRDQSNDQYLRNEALRRWSATILQQDLVVLRALAPEDPLADRVLASRLNRSDHEAVPALIEKIGRGKHLHYWWQFGRYVWSASLGDALDQALKGRDVSDHWFATTDVGAILGKLIMRLPELEAERLLSRHWSSIRRSGFFVQAALYVATDRTRSLVRFTLSECPEPAKLFEHTTLHIGVKIQGRPGFTREVQVRAFAEYLHLLAPLDVRRLWEACNDRGWFALRRELIDDHPNAIQLSRKLSNARAQQELDKYAVGHNHHSVDFWIDHALETGVEWAVILNALSEWLEMRGSFDALQVFAAALRYRGTRKDLAALRLIDGMPEEPACQLIADTVFAVRRRSLQ